MQQIENTAPADLLKDELHEYIEKMDEYQARLVKSFIQTLFNLSD